jgi:hypothetical protein
MEVISGISVKKRFNETFLRNHLKIFFKMQSGVTGLQNFTFIVSAVLFFFYFAFLLLNRVQNASKPPIKMFIKM